MKRRIINSSLKFMLPLVTAASLFTSCQKDALKSSSTTGGLATTKVSDSLTTVKPLTATVITTPLSNMFGVNTYPWDFLQNPSDPNDVSAVYQTKMNIINSFSGARHYLDWNYLEDAKNSFTYNPVNSGSWNLDAIYAACKSANITSLVDIKNCPGWFLTDYYPTALQNGEDVPAPYGDDLTAPASYTLQAQVAFQFAARYGSNAAVNKSLLSVNTTPRWTDDPINVIKVGLNTVKYMECDNERDMWWGGPATKQTAAEYAADMSAFYDGDMGKLGKNVGVKTADPNMIVVMGGLATADTQWVKDMITWCIQHRGYKADGSVNLCFDVINYHYYNTVTSSVGAAPELSSAASYANNIVAVAKTIKDVPQVWVTESGYDINSGSTQRAPAIGTKSALLVQADWILRTSLLYIKHNISRLFFYQLFDDTPNSSGTYATSGLADITTVTARPAANYILQTKTLMGTYGYVKTISTSPMVDEYTNGTKIIYALYMPTATGATATYSLNIGGTSATVYKLNPNSTKITSAAATPTSGVLKVAVSETPVFVSN